MTLVGQDKPSLEELMHFGVLGMKWGVRRKANASQIRTARRNLQNKQNDIFNQAEKMRTFEKGSSARAKAKSKRDQMLRDFNRDPDRVIAARLTRGEKVAALLLSAPSFGLLGIGTIAVSSAASRRIERKQELNKYPKK